MKTKKFWEWKNQAEPAAERVLELYGTIAETSWFDDDVTPQMFRDELFKGSGPVTIWVNSPGGDCIAASQIYTMLMEYPADVTVQIDGVAASAASVVAMAGTKVVMSPTALMMIHNPWTSACGDTSDMQKAIALLDEVKESIINAYETKSHLSRAKIAKMMTDETWLNAKKAKEMGFVDGILFENKKQMPIAPESDEPDEPEKQDDSLTAMTYSPSTTLGTFLTRVSATATPDKGTPVDQLEKRLALLKY